MELGELTESPGFWLLDVGGTAAIVLGYIMSKRMDLVAMPLWQVGAMVLVVWGAAAFFAMQNS